MALIPWRPFWDLDNFFSEWPELKLERAMRAPRMDIYEDKGNVVAEIAMPGLQIKDINVEIEDNVLKVSAESDKEKEEKKEGYYCKELSQQFYRRAVALPVEVDDKKAKASYKDGLLKVMAPKIGKKGPKKKKGSKIKVNKG